MTTLALSGPPIDFAGLSPLIALVGGACVVLLVGLFPARGVRTWGVPVLTLVTIASFAGLTIWQWGEGKSIVSGALRVDDLALALNLIFAAAAGAAVLLSWRALAPEEISSAWYSP